MPFKALFDDSAGFEVHGDQEVDVEGESLEDATKRTVEKFEAAVAGWTSEPSDVGRRALLLIGLALDDDCVWSKNNEVLLARLFMIRFGEDFKAHCDGVWNYRNGANHWLDELPEVTLRGIEASFARAKNFLLHLMHENIERDWASVYSSLNDYHDTVPASRQTCSADFKPDPDVQCASWALDLAKGLNAISTQFMSRTRSKDIVDAIGAWFQTEKPDGDTFINYDDSCLEIMHASEGDRPRLRRVPKRRENACYLHIPCKIILAADPDAVKLIRIVLCTTFAGNEEARFIDAAYEALFFFQRVMPQIALLYDSDGGNGKSARTVLRGNCMGDLHAVVSPEVLQVPEEADVPLCQVPWYYTAGVPSWRAFHRGCPKNSHQWWVARLPTSIWKEHSKVSMAQDWLLVRIQQCLSIDQRGSSRCGVFESVLAEARRASG
jgi:hypothetical protein